TAEDTATDDPISGHRSTIEGASAEAPSPLVCAPRPGHVPCDLAMCRVARPWAVGRATASEHAQQRWQSRAQATAKAASGPRGSESRLDLAGDDLLLHVMRGEGVPGRQQGR